MLTADAAKGKRTTAVCLERISRMRIVGQQMDAESGRGGSRLPRRLLHGACGEIEPLTFAITQGRQADPVQNFRFIVVEVENDRGGRAIKEVQPSLPSFSTKRETADAMAGQARQSGLTIR